MCIIAVIPQAHALPSLDILKECWRCNPDGGGLMYVEGGEIQIFKSMDKNTFLAEVFNVHHRISRDSPIVLHFRVGTCGLRSEFNCHPFTVNRDVAFAHNGQLFRPPKDSVYSDTHLFAIYLSELPIKFHRNRATLELIRAFASGDKLVFLDTKGRLTYINRQQWVEDDGIIYSNHSYKVVDRNWRGHHYRGYEAEVEDWEFAMGIDRPRNVIPLFPPIAEDKGEKPEKCDWCLDTSVEIHTVNWGGQIVLTICADCLANMLNDYPGDEITYENAPITLAHKIFDKKFNRNTQQFIIEGEVVEVDDETDPMFGWYH